MSDAVRSSDKQREGATCSDRALNDVILQLGVCMVTSTTTTRTNLVVLMSSCPLVFTHMGLVCNFLKLNVE